MSEKVVDTAAPRPKKRLLTRRNFLKAAAGVTVVGVGCYGYGALFEVHRIVVERVTIPIPGLAPAWHGKKVVQLSDLHAGRTSLKHIERAIGTAVDLQPDFVVLTGDHIDLSLDHLPNLCEMLRGVAAKVPVFACTGNHDFMADKAPRAETVCAAMRRVGVRVLRNEVHSVATGPGELCFAGIEDLWHGRPDPAILASAPADASIILLAHNPDAYESVAAYRWHLMLSGHTHGGQVCAPFFGPLILPIDHRERSGGLYHLDPAQPQRALYVNRGIGHLLKVRFLCPPEVTCFTLAGV